MARNRSICIIGPDGGGKTTHAKSLACTLESRGECVEYIHMFDRKSTLLNRLAFLLRTSTQRKEDNRHQQSRIEYVVSFVRTLARLLMTLPDSWMTYFYMKAKYRGRTVLCDRYFYDFVIGIGASEEKLAHLALKLTSLMPKPDIVIFLHAEPKVLHGRRKEMPLKQLQELDNLYRLFALRQNCIGVNTEAELPVVRDKLKGAV